MKKLFALAATFFVIATVVAQTTTFSIPGVQSYTVPAGVTQLSVDAVGGKGGNNNNWPAGIYASQGGAGGRVVCTINVTPGQVLQVYVGGQGTAGTTTRGVGGFNGGGNGGGSGTTYNGGGGGGGSDIRFSPYALADRKIVAGGGGGAGLNTGVEREKGGMGGGLVAQNGFASASATCGGGGTQVCCAAGQGAGGAGALGVGGNAVTTNAGGGGGGGYYGGGGGGSNWCGGGGGSSYTDAVLCTIVTHTQGANTTGDGYVAITPIVPIVTSSVSSLSFQDTAGGVSAAQIFSITATAMSSTPITVNTSSAQFQFSFNGSTWFSSAQSYPFTLPGFSNVPVYVRFLPAAVTTYSGSITISGGGLSSAYSVAVNGVGLVPCTGTPTVGTASAAPVAGVGSTPFTLSVSGYESTGAVSLQWQTSSNGVSGWTNITGATAGTYNFTGVTVSAYYRLNVTCGVSGITSSSNVVKIDYFPNACIPDYANTCSGGTPMYASIGSFIGILGTSFTDPASTCSSEYINNTATHNVSLYEGATYTPTLNVTTTYNTNYAAQMWIDFNGDGVFTSGETIGGQSVFSNGTPVVPVTIPAGMTPGTYRMRLVGNYIPSGGFNYPSLTPCVTTATSYGQSRDYTATIVARPACTMPEAQPTGLTASTTMSAINGSFTASVPAADNYLVVLTTSPVAPMPFDGISYVPGTNALGGQILSAGTSTTFSATGLSDNTTYWVWVFSYRTVCTGTVPMYRRVSPLSGSFTTLACSITGIKTIGSGGDYPTIASAVTAINTLGLGPNTSLEILPTYTGESYPITISGTLLCASPDRRLTIRPHSSNAIAKTITASTGTAMISLNGARYVNIDGRIGSAGSTKMLEFVNTNTSTLASTVEFINDASYNTVRHMTLRGAAIGSTTSGVVAFRTSTGITGNDFNVISNCDITDAGTNPVNCIYSVGTSGKENDNDTISDCNISNFYYNSSLANCGVFLSTASSGWTVSGNRIFQTATRAYTSSSSASMYGIYINNTTGNGFVVNNNIVGYANTTGTGTLTMTTSIGSSFRGIAISVGTLNPTVVQNNTISGINFSTTTTTTNNCNLIEVSSGSANITGNTIGSQTLTNAITRLISSNGAIGVRGIYATSATPANVTLSDNTIGGFVLQGNTTAIGTGMYGIDASGTAGFTITGNTIGSAATSGSITTAVTTTGNPVIYGIYCSISSSTHTSPLISGNTIANISSSATGTSCRFAGIVFNSTSSPVIRQNTIQNINIASSYTAISTDIALAGIMYTGSTGTAQILQNTVNALALTNTASTSANVAGILYTASLNGTISRNRIYDLRNASALNSPTSPPRALGIFLYSPVTSVTITNNMISLGSGQTSNTSFGGIMCGLNATYALRVYHNSVFIGGTAASGGNHSTCFDRNHFTTSSNTSITVDVRNNLFNNTRTGGTGAHYAISNTINGTANATGWPSATCNNNILNAANASAIAFWSGQRTIAAWRTASGNCDVNSYSGTAVTFADAANGNLHINMGTTSNDIESHGNLVAGVNTDIDGDSRPGPSGSVNGGGGAPDIGADEFDGVPNDNIPPVISYNLNTCGTSGDLVFTATIADPAGVATGAVAPRVYYRKNAAAFTLANSSAGVLTSGTVQNGVWTFTVSASALGGLVPGNTVSYFVIAQDVNNFVGSNTQAGMTAANVNSISVYPTNPTTYTVGLGGTYSVGTAGNYPTITSAVAAYNGATCLSGPVVFELISPAYAGESFPITINNHTWANATNTLTIKPASGVAATVTGSPVSVSMFRLFNARYVTMDGVNDNGSSLTLNNTYTSTSANIMLSSSGLGSGCRNIALRNMSMNGGSNTSSVVYGIIAIGNTTTPTTSSGSDNDTITIENNTITRCYYGIYCYQISYLTAAGGNNDWVIKNNKIGPDAYSATTNIGSYGMYLYGLINPVITGNTIQNIGQSTTSIQAVGIYVPSICYGFKIDSNIIKGITSLTSSTGTSSNGGMYIGSSVGNGSITRNTIQDIWNAQTGTSSARGIMLTSPGATANILLANNMISNIRHSGTSASTAAGAVGISIEGTYGMMRIYHNTVLLDGTTGGNAATFSACLYMITGSNNVDLRNNLFINKYNNAASGTDKGYAFYTTASNTIFNELNYNNFYVASPNVTAYTSADRVGLAAFQTAYGRNANSRESDASFVSGSDLRLTSTSGNAAFATGTPISEVPTDFDGKVRSTTNPVMGMHEVAFCASITAGTVNPAVATLCGSGTTTITATGATIGEIMEWRSSTDSVNWVTIAGANNDTYVLPSAITTTTWYRFVNKCSSSNLADSVVTKVVVNSLPAVITGTQTLCPGGTATLTSTAGAGTWSSSNPTVATVNSTSGLVTANAAGTANISFTLTSTGCVRTAIVTVNALPTVSGVTAASGIVCVGSDIALTAGTATGAGSLLSYNWSGPSSYSTTNVTGTISRTTSAVAQGGTYSLSVTYEGAGCTSAPATVPVTVNAVPTPGSISASSATLCTGATLTLNAASATGGSTLVSYNWSGPNAFSTTTIGASASLTVSPASSGEYSVSVTYTGTGCTSAMAKTDPDVTVNALPTLTSVTATNDVVCVGTDIELSANGATGTGALVSYNWTGPAAYSTTTLTNSVTRTTTATSHSGAYSVTVTYAGTGCTSALVQKEVTVNALPTLSGVTATPNPVCQNSVLTLTANGATGTGSIIAYQWSGPAGYSTSATVATQTFTVSATTASGVYSVFVTYTGVGCTSAVTASGNVTVNPSPIAYNVTGGGTYCVGESGVAVDLSNSQIGVNYQLYNGAALMGSPVSGTGAAVSFGLQTMAGTYTVVATNTATGCTAPMSGNTFVSISVVPSIYAVTGGGIYCEGTTAPNIGVSSSDISVSYQLYRDGNPVGGLVVGDGNPINFGPQTLSGVYSVIANPGSSCARTMTGTKTVTMQPAPGTFDVSGGGAICAGDAGQHVYLSWSVTGINYQLYRGSTAVGSPVAGAMAGLDMGVLNVAGTYTVRATNASTACGSDMNGSATIIVNPAPTVHTVTGGGVACEGENTVMVGLTGSDNNVSYQLYRGAVAVGSAVSGTGSAISFGPQNVSGVYTVAATNTITTCGGGMVGSATVSINPAPVSYNVTGGGTYCAGGSGYTIGMANTNVGIFYQLYRGAVTVGGPVPGTGAAISFGTFTATGTYTVLATNMLTSCSVAMNGSAVIGINPNPSVYSVTGGGAYCAGGSGVPVGLSFSSSAINYQLYNGSSMVGAAIPGNGSALSFGNQLAVGTYSVRATNPVTGCAIDMTSSATVVQNPLPLLVSVTGGGSYCAGNGGMPVGVNSSQTGVSYQLYRGSVPVGSALLGNGSALSYGNQTTDGVYTVMATNTATTCARGMTGSATIITNPLPPQYAVAGGGSYCAGSTGVEITLNGSDNGITYRLYNGSTAIGSPVPGNGFAISFGIHTLIGTYSVAATNTTTTCTNNMLGSVAVVANPLPVAYNVTGGGAACAGSAGVAVGLANSTTGVSYQLYNGATPMGTAVAGSGAAISFGNQTVTGTYTVLATNLSTLCTNAMSGNAGVTINALPAQYNVTGGGTYCENGSGVNVSLVGSQSGVNYQLYNGSTAMGSPVVGTGAAISFGSQTLAGTYTVFATNATTGCTRTMTSSATVIMSPAPVAHNVTGGGGYCIGGSGVNVGLNNSTIGISYQLYRGATAVGGVVAGTGDAINFGLQTVAGTYTVLATNTVTTCTNAMSGNAVVVINPLPVAYNISGGGGYCIGGTGVSVGVANTQTGVNYQLYRGTSAVGTPVAGTGAAISFGLQTVAGNYTVQATNATTGCVRGMNGYATVIINPLPVVYNVTGGGVYCAGGPGSRIGVALSEPGVNYQLYLGASPIGAPVTGSGAGIDFGEVFVIGSYSVVATNAATGCISPMSGSATVGVSTPPVAYNVTGGGSYCAGGTGVNVGISNSATGISYTLYRGTSAVGLPIAGTGSALSFGPQTVAGSYTVRATNSSGCATGMTGSATVIMNPVPASFAVTGGGSYCPGAGGVNIGLTGSAIGISYQLYIGSTPVGTPITGTGAVLAMGTYTTVGTYSAVATASVSGCTTNMSGTASVSQYTLPAVYSMTGGGNYCSGGSGVTVGLGASQTGVSYTLYRGAAVVGTYAGTGSALNFGVQTTAGSYSVRATNTTTGCVSDMTGTSVVGINALPTVYLTTGGGNYCAGGAGFAIILNGSNSGINYELYRNGTATGSVLAGTGTFINFGLQTVAGMYTVKATDATTGCVRTMAGSPEVIVHSLPVAHNVAGGGSYCAGGSGVEVSLANSSTGVSYQLYNGSTPIGTAVAGTGSSLSLGMQTTAGTYTVQALNAATGCTNAMAGSATITIIALPNAFAVTGGGGYCAGGNGVAVGLANTQSGVSYQLYRNGVAVGTALSGTGAAISYGLQTVAGTYTVRATAGTGCTSNMTGAVTVTVNPAPVVFTTGGGGSYCTGAAGVAVNVNGSETGVNYLLYNGSTATGALVAGTGGLVSFGPQTAGIYSVMAVNATTSCTAAMAGTVSVTANSLPVTWTVMGGGTFCQGSAGVGITLSGSHMNVDYSLFNGASATGTTLSGTGGVLNFGLHTTAGVYTVRATDMLTGCANNMNSSATVSVNPAPARFAMTGGGNYCPGGAGVSVGLSGSEAGITYNLYRNGVATGATVTGTGTAVAFALQTLTGNYTAMAVNAATGCTNTMNGSVAVGLHLAPTAYTVTGGGNYCNGGAGVSVALSGSSSGIVYRLYNGAVPVGTAIAGTGGALNFGMQTATGTYTVLATNQTTGCSLAMSGSANVVVNALPTVAAVTGGGAYCAGGAGVAVGVAATQTGVNYRLYKGTVAIGSAVAGTGAAISFGNISVAGTYTVAATNATTGCAASMSGSAVVNVNNLPTAQNVTGGGNYCAGSAGAEVALSGSELGINYQLYNGSTAAGTAVAGTGNILSLGTQSATGTYTVLATNTATGCTNAMAGSVPVTVSALPVAQTVSGGGAYCAGGNGVAVTLSGSQTGVTYRLYRGTTLVQTVAGTGSTLSMGMQTVAGMYTAMAVNTATSCTANMTGSASVTISPLPVAQSVGGGGSYCAGTAGAVVALAGSETGIVYTLYNNSGVAVATAAGSGEGISFGAQVTGSYTVRATNPVSGCTAAMLGGAVVNVNTLPVAYNVNGGGGYCEGGTGVPVSLGNSQSGVTYELYQNGIATGNIKNGSGASLTFGSQPVGVYSVVATSVATGCQRTMIGAATVYNYTQPAAFAVMGGGSYCAGGTGLAVTLSGSQSGVSYRLYRGTLALGTALAGNGSTLNFGLQTASGDYTIKATNNLTGCVATMTGVASISINNLPMTYTLTGGGSYCAGGSGVEVGLSSSDEGVTYQLYTGATATGSAMHGNNGSLSFGNQTIAGNYRVVATNDITGCTSLLSTTVSVSVNALPQVYTLSASAAGYCVGTNGVQITLNNSQTGVAYHLYNGATALGGAVNGTNGNGISFGFKTATGTYSVMAVNNTTGCTSVMSGTPSVTVFELPSVYAITGGGSYCAGTDGVPVGLIGTQSGVHYQLYRGGVAVGSPLSGSGSGVTFGTQPAGIYTVRAQNATTGCRNNMTGIANVEMNALPVAYNVTGGGTYCEGGAGLAVGLAHSTTGISYQLYQGTTAVSLPVAGTAAAISFGMQTAAGSYSVKATDLSTGCVATMNGNATISINAGPQVASVTGGGALCVGGAGVSINLTGSSTGISYRLHNGTSVIGTAVAGTGGAISFANVTAAGTYSVIATSVANGCSKAMDGTAAVVVNTLPVVANVTGGGAYCAGADGVAVGLDASVNGINYTLYQGATAVAAVAGTGSAISYGIHTGAGSYTVLATDAATGCTRSMAGSATISITPAVIPVVTLTSSASGAVCEGTLVTFTTTQTNGGAAPAYTWKVNGTTQASTTSSFGYIPANNDIVTVAMASNAQCAIPSVATASQTMVVNTKMSPVVRATVSVAGDTVCAGLPVTFTAIPEFGGSAPVFEWVKNGTVTATGNEFTFVPANGDVVHVRMVSNYECVLSGLANSETTTLSVLAPQAPIVNIVADPGTIVAKGQTVTFTANAANTYQSAYQWFVNGVAVHNATSATYTTANVEDNDTIACRITNVTPCGEYAATGKVRMRVNEVSVQTVRAAMDVRVMPNPTRGNLTITGSMATTANKQLHVEVTNMLGQVVYSAATEVRNGRVEATLNLSDELANGMYLLNLRTETETKVFHITLQR